MINLILFEKINSLAGQNVWLDRADKFLAVDAGYILVAVLILILVLRPTARNKLMFVVAALSAIVARGVVTTIIRYLYHSPRPFDAMHVTQLIPESGNSFPSGHAAFFFALSMGVYFYNKKMGVVFFVVSAFIGLARIFAGVHWPSDILGGLLVGVVTALVINFAALRIFGKQKPSVRGQVLNR